MLGKLLKYELKASARTLLPLYGALLVLSLINGFNMRLEYHFLTGIAIALTSGLCFAIAVCSFYLILQRFWTNLLRDEGYLMFTLPVKSSQLIWSKLISGISWATISCIVGLLAMLLWFAPLNWDQFIQAFSYLPQFYAQILLEFNRLNASFPLAAVESILLVFVFGAYQILVLYCAMAVGQLPAVSRYRVLASFGAYLMIHWAVQNLVILAARLADQVVPLHELIQRINLNLGLALILAGVTAGCALFFLLTNYLLKNKLNLE